MHTKQTAQPSCSSRHGNGVRIYVTIDAKMPKYVIRLSTRRDHGGVVDTVNLMWITLRTATRRVGGGGGTNATNERRLQLERVIRGHRGCGARATVRTMPIRNKRKPLKKRKHNVITVFTADNVISAVCAILLSLIKYNRRF